MEVEQLRLLLGRSESPTVEFKRKFYEISSADGEVKKRHRAEFAKDILSLANGNASVAGETACLVIGADDELDEDGNRTLYDIGEVHITSQQILGIVNSVCNPPLQDVWPENITVDGKRLLVITILPTPHLHETTRKLETPSTTYNKHVVFIRHNESIEIASDKEREAIRQLKQIRYNEAHNAPPIAFGAAVGALLVGGTGANYFEKNTDFDQSRTIGWVIGALLGGLLGGLMGSTYKSLRTIQREWPSVPKQRRPLLIVVGTLGGSIAFGLVQQMNSWVKQRVEHHKDVNQSVLVNQEV